MGMPGLADLELTHGEAYENYEQWFLLTGDNGGWATLWAAFDKRFGAKGIIPMENGFAYNEESDTVFADAFNSLPVAALDFGEYVAKTGPNSEDLLYHGLPESFVTPLRFLMTPTERNSWSWRMGISIPIGR